MIAFNIETYKSFPTASTELKLFFISEKFVHSADFASLYQLSNASVAFISLLQYSLIVLFDIITISILKRCSSLQI